MSKTTHKKKKAILFHDHRFEVLTNEAPYAIRLHDCTWPTVSHYLIGREYNLMPSQVQEHTSVYELLLFVAQGGMHRHNKWLVYRDSLLLDALRAKFSQHLDLEAVLCRTGNARLIYVNNENTYLGVTDRGEGVNMLGRMLMRVRREIGRPLIGNYVGDTQFETDNAPSIVDTHSDSVEALLKLVSVCLECAEFEMALRAARRVVSIDADCMDGHQVVAMILIWFGKYSEAIGHLRECIRLDPLEARHCWWMSIIYEQIGKPVAAHIYADRARRLTAI